MIRLKKPSDRQGRPGPRSATSRRRPRPRHGHRRALESSGAGTARRTPGASCRHASMFEGVTPRRRLDLRRQRQDVGRAIASCARYFRGGRRHAAHDDLIEAIRTPTDVADERDDAVVMGEDVGHRRRLPALPRGCSRNTARTAAPTPISALGIVGAIGMAAYRLRGPASRCSSPTTSTRPYDQIGFGGGAAALPLQRRLHLPDRGAHADRRLATKIRAIPRSGADPESWSQRVHPAPVVMNGIITNWATGPTRNAVSGECGLLHAPREPEHPARPLERDHLLQHRSARPPR